MIDFISSLLPVSNTWISEKHATESLNRLICQNVMGAAQQHIDDIIQCSSLVPETDAEVLGHYFATVNNFLLTVCGSFPQK